MELLSLVEPLSCIVHGWRKLSSGRELQHGYRFLVQGAGIIGSLWTCLLHYKGFRNVTVSEPSPARRDFIKQLNMGFDVHDPADVKGDFKYRFHCCLILFHFSVLLLIVLEIQEQSKVASIESGTCLIILNLKYKFQSWRNFRSIWSRTSNCYLFHSAISYL